MGEIASAAHQHAVPGKKCFVVKGRSKRAIEIHHDFRYALLCRLRVPLVGGKAANPVFPKAVSDGGLYVCLIQHLPSIFEVVTAFVDPRPMRGHVPAEPLQVRKPRACTPSRIRWSDNHKAHVSAYRPEFGPALPARIH
jgi:hypothetical protein